MQISVVIPVYNGAMTIGRALDSLLTQTHTDFEVLVVNDGSQDNTQDVVQGYCKKDSRFQLISYEKNRGVSYARNQGLKAATGKWISLLDADDWMAPQRLERLLNATGILQADIVFDNLKIIHPQSQDIIEITCFGDKGATLELTLQELFESDTPYMHFAIGYVSPFLRTEFFRENNITYNEAYTLSEDFTLLAEAFLNGATAYVLPFADYYYTYKPAGNQKQSAYTLLDNKYDQVITACNSFMTKYKDQVPDQAYRAIERRRDLFKCLSQSRRLYRMGWQSGWLGRVLDYISSPYCLWFLVKLILLRLSRLQLVGLTIGAVV